MHSSEERGIALITTLLVMMLISALLVAFTTLVMSDQRYRFIDKDRSQAFYAAAGGVEKLTADLGNTFLKTVGVTNAQVTALTTVANQPVISNVAYTAINAPTPLPASELGPLHCYSTGAGYPTPGTQAVNRAALMVGTPGYTVTFCANTATNNPTTLADAKTITQGTYAGLYALKMPYQIDVTAKTATGGEAHLSRTIEAVSIPVFQFGIFSDVDLAFHSGDNFAFGGRVHTNGNLFLSVGAGNTLTLSDKVTAYKDVIRAVLPNGNAIANNNGTGTINVTKGNGAFRALASTEGSVQGGPGSTPWGGWSPLSLSTYNGYIKDGAAGAARGTGAKQLTLPIVATGVGGQNVDLIRRPAQGDDPTSILYQERLFTKASIRVLLSDTTADITNIPGVDNTAPPLPLEAGNSYPGVANVFANPIPIATSLALPAWSGTQINAAIAAGNNVSMSLNGGVPATLKVTMPLTAGTAPNNWTISACTAKTLTTFTGCSITKNGTAGSPIPVNTVITSAALPGISTTLTAQITLNGGGPWTNQTVNVNSTLNFSPNTFWIDEQRVTCTGYSTGGSLTGCNVAIAIPINEKLDVPYRATPVGTSTIGGFIKVERLNAANGLWVDMTPEMLQYGIGAPAQLGSCSGAGNDPSPNAIIRIQRLADDSGSNPTTCPITANGRAFASTDFWPNTLFDAREAFQRSNVPANNNIKLGGVMHYVAIDAGNLARWFAGQAPYTVANLATGTQSKPDNTGYSIYISDRRNNRDVNSKETGEFGWEDFVNPADANGTPNGVLDAGEDLNANALLDVYGGKASCNGVYNTFTNGAITCSDAFYSQLGVGAINPLLDMASTAAPINDPATVRGTARSMTNRAIMFRRAVMLVNGNNLVASVGGFTAVSENPVYVKGDWNANGGNFNGAHAATAIIADAVTILSNAWVDAHSYWNLYSAAGGIGGGKLRSANSWYRVAVLAGKGAMFPLPAGQPADFGSDGGVHNYLRYLEGSPGGDTVNYMGSMASLFYNRQAVGLYKTNGVVYGVPGARAYSFDQDFLNPLLLPPLTPMFRDMDTVGFSQQLQPGK